MQRLALGIVIVACAGHPAAAEPAAATAPADRAVTGVPRPQSLPSAAKPVPAKPAPRKVQTPPPTTATANAPPAVKPSPATQSAVPAAPPAATAAPAQPPLPATWTDADITIAQARCKAVLAGVDAVVVPQPPMRSGACGAAAPVRVISIGKSPEVALFPPPVLTCDMVATLSTWVKKDVQPLALKHLGVPIIKIETMSDYSCRAAYGRVGNRLSEHGRANALDIRGFVTARNEMAMLLDGWGQTRRSIARTIAAAKAAAEKAEKERMATVAKAATPPTAVAAAAGALPVPLTPPAKATASALNSPSLADDALEAVRGIVRSTIIEGTTTAPDRSQSEAASPAFGHTLSAPSRLGGPKPAATNATAGPEPADTVIVMSKKGRFLREVHRAACRIFGTTLGPEANEAHRNHLHLDMAERRNGLKICE